MKLLNGIVRYVASECKRMRCYLFADYLLFSSKDVNTQRRTIAVVTAVVYKSFTLFSSPVSSLLLFRNPWLQNKKKKQKQYQIVLSFSSTLPRCKICKSPVKQLVIYKKSRRVYAPSSSFSYCRVLFVFKKKGGEKCCRNASSLVCQAMPFFWSNLFRE